MVKEMLIRVGDDTIYLTLDIGVDGRRSGAIRSSFKDGAMPGSGGTSDDPMDDDYGAMIDGLESVVLGHACAGVDVQSPAYVAGLVSAVEAIANHS